jgi:hypothetical protein
MNIVEDIYENFLNNIKDPPDNKKIWNIPNNNKLAVCLIEFRQHKWMKQVLYNMAHVYGGSDVSLYIVHGIDNEQYIKDFIKDWKNVNFIKYPYENITREFYAEMCCDADFYKNFKTEFMLKFECDTLIRKPIDEHFFQYSYVGAPWTGYPNDYPDNPHIKVGNKLVGNGGFSLRNVKRMIEVCEKCPKLNKKLGEDVHLTNCLLEYELPSKEIAKKFSVEWIYYDNPCGLHQIYRFHTIENIISLIKDLPGIF